MLLLTAACTRAEQPEFDWGTQHVVLSEWWPGAMAGHDPTRWKPGVQLWRWEIVSSRSAIEDVQSGQLNDAEHGPGIVGMLEGPIGAGQRLDLISYGRSGKTILVKFTLHPGGNWLPGPVQQVVRRKHGTTITEMPHPDIQDAAGVGITGRYVFLAATLPVDLPDGDYDVVVEVHDADGALLQRHDHVLRHRPPPVDPLDTLSDRDLLAEYVRRGEALRGTGLEPTDSSRGLVAWGHAYTAPAYVAWSRTGMEMRRRSDTMVPLMLELLEREATRNPEPEDIATAEFGLATDLMNRLAEMGDPRAVPVLIRIVSGSDGRANSLVRHAARLGLERLTHVTFLQLPRGEPSVFAMLGSNALRPVEIAPNRQDELLKQVAALYTDWFAEHAEAPEIWLPMARERARTALRNGDEFEIKHAIALLGTPLRSLRKPDDDPHATAKVLADLWMRQKAGDNTVQIDPRRLATMLASRGPAARPWVDQIIETLDAQPTAGMFPLLADIGGKRVTEYMVSVLPRLQIVEPLPRHRPLNDMFDDLPIDLSAQLQDYSACRFWIERLAGRTFDDDNALNLWWDKARHLEPQQWLTENLPHTLEQADAGNAKAQAIARILLPDLPHKERDKTFDVPRRWNSSRFYEQPIAPFRVDWFKANEARLQFDADHMRWVLPGARNAAPGE